jgi:hypothetical protein
VEGVFGKLLNQEFEWSRMARLLWIKCVNLQRLHILQRGEVCHHKELVR